LKLVSSLFVLVFWISSWFPTSADKGAVTVAAGCVLGLIVTYLVQRQLGERAWATKVIAALAIAVLIGGALFALITGLKRTSVDGGITFFFVLGFVGYLLMVKAILAPKEPLGEYRGEGLKVLFVVAIWSWASAISMFSHRGVDTYDDDTCIVVSKPNEYDTTLKSIWDMRLPQIASRKTT
jgi:hypothetical protein